jgi:Ca2+-transporting ATPase
LFYDESIKDVYLRLNSSEKGLSKDEATARLLKDGENSINKDQKLNPIKLFFEQFKNFLIILLLFAAVISFALGEILDFTGIITIIILTVILGFIQEYRAEEAMEALKKLSAPNARIIREGKEEIILSKEIVGGDIIILEEGEIVPADARIIECSSLEIDESSLTGESVPSKKDHDQIRQIVPIADQENMTFMGTIITYGKGKAIVTATGMRTEFGKIAHSIQSIEDTQTPLQRKFEQMARQLGYATIGLVLIVFLLGIFTLKTPIMELFIFSLSLAVAAVPSSLPAIVAISLGLGAKRLASKNMIIKKLPAAESLGSVTVICTDKTGTITKNQMTVTKIFTGNKEITISGAGYYPKGEFIINGKQFSQNDMKIIEPMLRTGYLCNNSKLGNNEGKWDIIGDPTEAALRVMTRKALPEEYFEKNFARTEELPFDSNRKSMSVICENYLDKKTEAYVKGAPDMILKLCDRILIDGKVRNITKNDKDTILQKNNEFAEESLRVLGLAYKDVSKIKKRDIPAVEKDLIFLGLAGMIDPPREGVSDAINKCREAGIKVVMITGDHPTTAKAIGKQIGLLREGDIILTGTELDAITDIELEKQIEDIRILARALPIQKTRIVTALQKKGNIVAMTGDGVNDAPALKKADIGIAMGITGTDISKEVAKSILADDNFNTIVNAIAEGRNIYDKIIKSTKYLLACNSGEIVSVFLSILFRLPLPMIPLQILMMNLLTDGLPALGLGSENAEDDVMKRKPRNPKDNPINRSMLLLIIIFGISMGLGTLFVFRLYIDVGIKYAQTMAFTTLVMFEMFAVLSARSFKAFKGISFTANKWLTLGIISSIAIQLAVIYVSPLQVLFGTTAIGLKDWAILLAVSSLGFIIMELSKILIKEKKNDNNMLADIKTSIAEGK